MPVIKAFLLCTGEPSFLVADLRSGVLGAMGSVGCYSEILDSVVRWVSVQMVHELCWLEFSSQMCFYDQSMLISVGRIAHVAIRPVAPATGPILMILSVVPFVVACRRAEPSLLVVFD